MKMHHTFRADAADRTRTLPWLLLLLGCAALALWIGWIGFEASDDSLYWQGAMKVMTQPPFPGDNHWTTRFPLTITFAAMLRLMGQGFAAFAVTAMIFYACVVAVTGMFAGKVAGARSGWIAALLTATLPVIVSHATTVSVDLIEAAALILGITLLGGARADRAGYVRGVAAGVAFGVAVLCRETSVLPLVGLVPLFLLGRPVPRGVLVAVGVGVAVVLGGEALYQWALTGDPLRRYTIAFNHDDHIDRAANMEGNLLLWPPIDPLLVLLVNDDFGLLFWAAGAALALGAWRMVPVGQRGRMVVLSAMAGAMFLLVAVLYGKLVLNPRYFTLPALAAVVIVAIWAAGLSPRWRMLLLAAIVGSNLLLMGVGNAHPRWVMEAMVEASGQHPRELIAADPQTVRRALIPMLYAGRENLRYAPARPGGLEIADAEHAPAGQVVARYPSPATKVGAIFRALGLEPLVPHAIARRMFAPSPEAVLVRRPD
ncbi:Dolichyl-phosphate-mannose-protein mannosyltransferase [Sphingomonas palmae]|uniref:Dolichyl-phosphate-mannose-protein mannosyltransferase n=1 Tax=Sphingomonas palmae TaxID=1855283 RepID=A0A1H7FLQ7_9SPHN|nr:glycosyltransferase family 39 protein [Sphingomonas palmae]SEK27033.1 Dolichyl-phosphate-mannose-protein mannosyltransferase [Sphingomonas palmae]